LVEVMLCDQKHVQERLRKEGPKDPRAGRTVDGTEDQEP
jgi:hypothetical protein